MNSEAGKGAGHVGEAHLEHFHKHIRAAIGVFVALLVLTAVTVGASYIHLGHEGNIVLALIIAAIKAGLVAAIFMHLIAEKRMVFRVLAFTVIFFAGLFLLILFTFGNAVDPSRVP
jgi:cytochrome c oxidase subunit 4